MVKELYQIHTQEISLNITNGKIDSVRKKNILRSGCRIYDGGCIGVAGTLGEPTEDTWQAAREALSLQVPYPYQPGSGLRRSRVIGSMPEEKEFIQKMEAVLDTLGKEFPGYVLSNKVNAQIVTETLRNDAGLDLTSTCAAVYASIIVKEEASPNVFDSAIAYASDHFDPDRILEEGRSVLGAHSNPIPMPEENLPVIITSDNFIAPLATQLNGKSLAKGASLFSGKVGQKLFSEKITLLSSRKEDTFDAFFDAEGTTLEGDAIALIEKGVLLRGLGDKLCQGEYGSDLTASADGAYDDVPALGGGHLTIEPTGSREEILQGSDAIVIWMASGGDTTPTGDYATPVQTAYLMRDGKLIARLPEFNFGGSLFRLLGDGFLGCTVEKICGNDHPLIVKGDIR